MKKILAFLLLTSLMAACASNKVIDLYEGDAQQAGLIQSSPTVQFKYVDDDPVKSGFVGQTHTYEVGAGQRTIMVEYSDLFEVSNDEHDKVVSRPAKIAFKVEAGKTYQVSHDPQKKLEQAQAFAEKPSFWVINTATNKKVDAKVELSRPRTFLTSLQSAVTPVYEFESDKVVKSPESSALNTSDIKAASRLEALQNIWADASSEEREAFLKWIER